MAERIPTDEEERLADRLRLEARERRPAFSEALHARICESLKHTEIRVKRDGVPRWLRSRWLAVAIAATLLLSIPWVAWLLQRSTGPANRFPNPEAIAALPEPLADPGLITGSAANAAGQVAAIVDSTASNAQWAYLDHDARVALELLKAQLPFDVASIE